MKSNPIRKAFTLTAASTLLLVEPADLPVSDSTVAVNEEENRNTQ